MGFPTRLADHVADLLPHRRLGDEIDVGVRIVFPALALENTARLTATGIVPRTWRRVAERDAFAVLAVLGQRSRLETLLIAQLDAAKVEHAVLHRDADPLALAGVGALIERGDNA